MTDKLRSSEEALLEAPPCRPLRALAIVSVLAILSALCAGLLSWISG